MTYQKEILDHYEHQWKQIPKIYLWDKGPLEKMHHDFRVLEFSPSLKRNMWTYATCCMSQEEESNPIELHIFSLKRDQTIIELLTSLSYYYKNTLKFDLWHTINFGRPWQNESVCDYGLVSLPYLDGPELENLKFNKTNLAKFYWLIPVTKSEVEYKNEYGIEALEMKFDQIGLDYVNPNRESII